jgi:ACT domain-containing protein
MGRSKYRKSIANRICEMIRLDSFTLAEICDSVGISRVTYYEWEKSIPYFSDAIRKAKDDRDLKLVTEARKSLLKKLTGYEAEEEKTVYITNRDAGMPAEPIIKEQTITRKHFQPDTAAIIFTLCNKDNWTNKYAAELTGKDGESLFQGVVIQKTYETDKTGE